MSARGRTTHGRRLLGASGLVLALIALPVAASATTAGSGENVGVLRARAAALVSRIDSTATEIHVLATQYYKDTLALTAAEVAVAASRSLARRDGVQLQDDQALVRHDAVLAYVEYGSDPTTDLLMSGTPSSAAEAATYLGAESDGLALASNALIASRRQVATDLVGQNRAVGAAEAALTAAGAARAQVLSEAQLEEQTLNQVHGQLTSLVAVQEAAQALAQREAEKAAASVASRTSPTAASLVSSQPRVEGPPSAAGVAAVAPTAGVVPASISADFAGIRRCESGGDYSLDTGNGFYGAYQFALSTWESLGMSGLPSSAPPAVQDAAAYHLFRLEGWSPWPACSAILGL